ncbi:PSD1 and planctomycete cytochrome C domain-containing protein [Verrucomicrobiales bacterium BCK34]|nr:PSD1 and planctomycete cytochrome C domain-containing protein [Verrucomicrobiales bacterium BCK34]
MTQPCSVSIATALVAGVFLSAPLQAAETDGAAFYKEKVFPILKEHCFKCHGTGDHLKGDFRITSREGLMLGGEFGAAHDEANPAASVLLEMISYKGDDYQMPPKGKLSDAKIAVLTEWMERGAPYDPALEIKGEAKARRGFTVSEEDRNWWAYKPVSKNAPPKVDDAAWQKNGIDAFVRSQLDSEALTPNEPASAQTLIRRLYYDLIGLPPAPADVESFIAAYRIDPEASYAALIEDLLSRPQYGEKWARHWLDLVRYAETNGFERDNPKPYIWRYRDYVIDAFNENKPYDQFVIEQLAGDEIAEPTMDSLVATGYHRLMQWDDEPADRKQHVYDVLADNVQITSETFLATTMGCSRCHDHKADPISQKDYYSFMAFFAGVTHYTTPGTIVNWASPDEKKEFEKERKAKLAALEKKRDEAAAALTKHLQTTGVLKGDSGTGRTTMIDDARGNGAEWFYTTTRPTADWSDVGFINKSWFKAKGGFGAANPPNSHINTKWHTPEIWMRTTFGLKKLPQTLVLEIHHDEDVEVFLNGTLIHSAKSFTRDYETVILGGKALSALQTGKNTVAVHCKQTGGGQYIDLSLHTDASAVDLQKLLSGPKGRKLENEVKKATGKDWAGVYNESLAEIAKWRTATPGIPVNAVTENKGGPTPMHIHLRGSAHAEGDLVESGLPAVLASRDSEPAPVKTAKVANGLINSSGRRLALANWIVDEKNPLTARVMINRIWQHHFGRGIVPSTSDFGHLGEKPSHPELLDWLAREFVESGWDMKAMHRLMLMSNTYRMSSEPNSGNLDKDPQNRNFWRYDMRRLTAEEMRDSILTLSGKLNLKSKGEWVFPPLPPEVLSTSSKPGSVWPVSAKEEDHFRRSLYVHVKRSLRHQMLADFDQADTDTTCAVRFVTTVPTQALTMLNSKFVNDQAGLLADRLAKDGGELRAQIANGLELALQRKAGDDELDHLVSLHGKLMSEAGLSSTDAMKRVALVTLNLNEFVYLD